MDMKIKIKNALSNYNPFAISHRNRMQKKLVNRDFFSFVRTAWEECYFMIWDYHFCLLQLI